MANAAKNFQVVHIAVKPMPPVSEVMDFQMIGSTAADAFSTGQFEFLGSKRLPVVGLQVLLVAMEGHGGKRKRHRAKTIAATCPLREARCQIVTRNRHGQP